MGVDSEIGSPIPRPATTSRLPNAPARPHPSGTGHLRTHLKILPQQFYRLRAGEAEAEESIHGALLNLRAGLPAGDRRFAHAEQVGQLLLGQSEFLAPLADFLWGQQPRFAPEGSADLLVGRVVDANATAVAAPRHGQRGNLDRVRPAVVLDGGRIRHG